jgi:hypothetical protein
MDILNPAIQADGSLEVCGEGAVGRYAADRLKAPSRNTTPAPDHRAARRGTCSLDRDSASRDAIRPEREKCRRIE